MRDPNPQGKRSESEGVGLYKLRMEHSSRPQPTTREAFNIQRMSDSVEVTTKERRRVWNEGPNSYIWFPIPVVRSKQSKPGCGRRPSWIRIQEAWSGGERQVGSRRIPLLSVIALASRFILNPSAFHASTAVLSVFAPSKGSGTSSSTR